MLGTKLTMRIGCAPPDTIPPGYCRSGLGFD